MDNIQNPMEIFQKEAPDVAKAFDSLIQSIRDSKGLDEKTKQLIYIAMKAALGDPVAVKFHVPMAKKLGAKREEVVDAIIMTITVAGIKPVVSMLPEALKIYDEN